MKILAIDTATKVAGAAIADENGILAECEFNVGKTHSQILLPMVQSMLTNVGVELNEMDAFAVTVGPGSFTGLRIGIATVKAWSQALNIPIVSVTTMEALARASAARGFVCPVLDARKNEVYCSLFTNGMQSWPTMAISPQELVEKLQVFDKPITFLGDGIPYCQDIIKSGLGNQARIIAEENRFFMASSAAVVGRTKFLRKETITAAALEPFYLRVSEAEKRMQQKNEEITHA